MAHGAKQARKIRIHDKEIKTICGIPLRTIILMFIFLVMGGGWGKFKMHVPFAYRPFFPFFKHEYSLKHSSKSLQGFIVHGQVSGDFFEMKYPHCHIPEESHYSYVDMGNKKCDGILNTIGKCHKYGVINIPNFVKIIRLTYLGLLLFSLGRMWLR